MKGDWLSCFIHEGIPEGAALYDASPGALYVTAKGTIEVLAPRARRLKIPAVKLSPIELEQFAGLLLDRAAHSSEGAYYDVPWVRKIMGPSGPLLVCDPEFVGVCCDFGEGYFGLAVLGPKAVKVSRGIGRYEVINGDLLDLPV